jgi:hypothetical protein
MKFINSIFAPDMSGRLGGNVFAKNKYGYYIKMFKAPSNPRTDYQQNIRAFFASASRQWQALTDAQRTNWDSIAATYSYVKGGVSFSLTGFNFFVKLNRNLQDIAQSFYEDIQRSTLITPPDMSGSTVDVVTTPGLEDISLNIPAALDVNTKAIVYATPVLKASRKPDFKQLRVITTIDHSFISGGSIKVAYIAKFGAMPATGDKVAFAIMPVNSACGLTNSKVYTTSIGTV